MQRLLILVAVTALVLIGWNYDLSQAGLVVAQIGETVIDDYTVDTDPDQLLGLAGQYTSKATFRYGSVEVFATPRDRDLRADRLQQQSDSYLYRANFTRGSILLRLEPWLDWETANAYGRRLRSVSPLL